MTDLETIKNHSNTGGNCSKRNNTKVDELKGGMGDLFVKISTN